MARRAKRKHGCLWRFVKLALVALLALAAYMVIDARVVRVERAQVYLNDLPEAFDGVSVLFLSDLHIGKFASADSAAKLLEGMQTLYPDILVLGGDYTGGDSLAIIGQQGTTAEEQRAARDQFFERVGWFYTPMGKYSVRGNHDPVEGLKQSMARGGVTLLDNGIATIEKDGQKLYIAGLDDWRTGVRQIEAIAAMVGRRDAVIVVSHNPDAFPALIRQPSAEGGAWADLVLSGHTHGGQVAVLGLEKVITPSFYRDRYLSGWFEEGGSHMLVSNGVGTTVVPVRLRAPAQAHLITLRRGA